MMTFAPLLALALAAAPYTPAPADQVPGYYTRAITPADLSGKGLRDLAILRNTIYARWGWDGFRKKWLHDYFHAQRWFKPNPDFSYGLVSDLDRKNAHAIGTREASFTDAQLQGMEHALFKKYRVSFGDMEVWKYPDGHVERFCADSVGAVGGAPVPRLAGGNRQGRDCTLGGGDPLDPYQPDPKSTLATLPAEARTELGLIQRAMGFFAVDDDDHLADPNGLDKLLKLSELRQLSGRDLRILRNTIYARRGRPFKSKVLREYFEDKRWYHADPKYTDARLTKIDQRNVALVKSVEEELGGPITDDEQERSLMDANFDGA